MTTRKTSSSPRRDRYGEPCTLNPFDLGPGQRVTDGDILATEAGSCYLITRARRVNSTVHPNRWRLDCVRLDPATVDPAEIAWTLRWYPRDRRR